jgi:hypothetical protein
LGTARQPTWLTRTGHCTFTAGDDAEADVHLLECADYLENASLWLSAIGRTIERI